MISYQKMYERCQNLSSDDDAATLLLFKALLSEAIKKCYAVLNAEHFYDEATDKTVASQNAYPLPAQCGKIHTIKTTVSSVDYIALEWAGTEEQWNVLTNGSGSTESAYPQWFFVKNDTVELYPTPSADDYVLTFKYKIIPKALSADDHTTESIKIAVVGSTAIVGNTGVLWTAAMAGRYLNITDDGVDYKIASITDATNLVLDREWAGIAITAGTEKYTIKECSLLPDDFQTLPLKYCLWKYYQIKEKLSLANDYKQEWYEGLQELKETGGNLTTSGVLEEDFEIKNANDWPKNLS